MPIPAVWNSCPGIAGLSGPTTNFSWCDVLFLSDMNTWSIVSWSCTPTDFEHNINDINVVFSGDSYSSVQHTQWREALWVQKRNEKVSFMCTCSEMKKQVNWTCSAKVKLWWCRKCIKTYGNGCTTDNTSTCLPLLLPSHFFTLFAGLSTSIACHSALTTSTWPPPVAQRQCMSSSSSNPPSRSMYYTCMYTFVLASLVLFPCHLLAPSAILDLWPL